MLGIVIDVSATFVAAIINRVFSENLKIFSYSFIGNLEYKGRILYFNLIFSLDS